jgi:hypothetical protein
MRPMECRSYQLPGSAGRRGEEHRRRAVTIGWMCPRLRWMATGWYTDGSERTAGTSGAAGMAGSRR